MGVELKAAVERLNTDADLSEKMTGGPFASITIADLRLVLASLQAPCPGKAGELATAIREWRKRWDHRSDVAEHAIRKGNAPRRSGVQVRHADEVVLMLDTFLAFLSAQPVPGGNIIGRLGRIREFIENEVDNRDAAGALMSDYDDEAKDALNELDGVLAMLSASPGKPQDGEDQGSALYWLMRTSSP